MVEGVVIIAGVLLAAVLFAVWFTVRMITWVVGGVFGLGRAKRAPAQALPFPGTAACLQGGCRETNPHHARFCRRCGIALARDARDPRPRGAVPMRYVA
jgi:hypothetical protein